MTDNQLADKEINASTHESTTSPYYQTIMSLEPKFREKIENIYKMTFNIEQINILIDNLNSTYLLLEHQGCIGLRKLLSVQYSKSFQIVIDANCVPRLIEFIKQTTYPILQLEASWCLSNISSEKSYYTQIIVDQGAIPLFCNLLDSPFGEISKQAIWAIANISGDMILQCNGLKSLITILLNTKDSMDIKICTWAISNLCIGYPLPQYELVKDSVFPLCKALMSETDSEILIDCSVAISKLCDENDDKIQQIISTGVIPTLIRLLSHEKISVLVPCARILGIICTGSDEQTETVLVNGGLTEISKLFKHDKKIVLKEACWVLSNIAAGNEKHIDQIINQDKLVTILFDCMLNNCLEIVLEASQVICNCTSQANFIYIDKLVKLNILNVYTDILNNSQEAKTIIVILKSLQHILECGKKHFIQDKNNSFIIKLKGLGALNIIEKLQEYPDETVQQNSSTLLEKYFNSDDQMIDIE